MFEAPLLQLRNGAGAVLLVRGVPAHVSSPGASEERPFLFMPGNSAKYAGRAQRP
jgi:hypothetical protein